MPTRKSSADPRLQEAYNKWNEVKTQFVDNLIQLYNSPFFRLWRIDASMVELTEETAEFDLLLVKRSDQKKEKKKHIMGRRKKVHLVFDAIMLQEQWSPDQQEEFQVTTTLSSQVNSVVPKDRMVFIDNLPIDVEETEIIDNYSRCGPIESVQLFHKRPDLDPGPMSKQKTREAIKSQVFKFQTRRRWERRRTPLYGVVTFATQEGYQKATQDALRVFGMVIRKHPVRSYPASEMKKFYLDGILPGFFSVDVEHTVSSLLHPDVYVCLGTGFRNYDEPTSCEFRFGSFEAAYSAFKKLEKELNMGSNECKLNWMRTPRRQGILDKEAWISCAIETFNVLLLCHPSLSPIFVPSFYSQEIRHQLCSTFTLGSMHGLFRFTKEFKSLSNSPLLALIFLIVKLILPSTLGSNFQNSRHITTSITVIGCTLHTVTKLLSKWYFLPSITS